MVPETCHPATLNLGEAFKCIDHERNGVVSRWRPLYIPRRTRELPCPAGHHTIVAKHSVWIMFDYNCHHDAINQRRHSPQANVIRFGRRGHLRAQPLFYHGLKIIMKSTKVSQISKWWNNHIWKHHLMHGPRCRTGRAHRKDTFDTPPSSQHTIISLSPLKIRRLWQAGLALSLCKAVIIDVIQDATNVCPVFPAMGQFGRIIKSD